MYPRSFHCGVSRTGQNIPVLFLHRFKQREGVGGLRFLIGRKRQHGYADIFWLRRKSLFHQRFHSLIVVEGMFRQPVAGNYQVGAELLQCIDPCVFCGLHLQFEMTVKFKIVAELSRDRFGRFILLYALMNSSFETE